MFSKQIYPKLKKKENYDNYPIYIVLSAVVCREMNSNNLVVSEIWVS